MSAKRYVSSEKWMIKKNLTDFVVANVAKVSKRNIVYIANFQTDLGINRNLKQRNSFAKPVPDNLADVTSDSLTLCKHMLR